MRITAIAILLFLNYCGLTQNGDIGLSLGGSNYSGDLTESLSIAIKQTHPCLGLHYRLEMDPLISFKLQYMYLKVSGDDKYSKRLGNKDRHLSFESDIHEISVVTQLQLLNLWNEQGMRWNPFLQIGLSVFKFNPTTQYKGVQVDLEPLGTEGQGMVNYSPKYSLVSYSFDLGFGLRYFLNSRYSLTLDVLARYTNTDYLDDASTNYVGYEVLLKNNGKMAADLGNKILAETGTKRANPGDKDWYESVVLTLSYHFGNNYAFRTPGLKKYQILCPRF